MQRCHTYKIAVSKYILRALGGGGGGSDWGGGGQDGCERRIKVFVKIQKKNGGGGRVGGGGVVGLGGGGVRVDVNREVQFL